MSKEESDFLKEENMRLAKSEEELKLLYCQLGKLIMELADEKRPFINNLVDEIVAQRKYISEIKGE